MSRRVAQSGPWGGEAVCTLPCTCSQACGRMLKHATNGVVHYERRLEGDKSVAAKRC